MRVAVGTDHAGFDLKETVLAGIRSAGHEALDLGAHVEKNVDYLD